jgi:predicted DNA-binding transcriptional regulator AlpA
MKHIMSKKERINSDLSCNTQNLSEQPLNTNQVMTRLGYRDRSAFWESVHRNHIPYTRLSKRRIIFDRQQLQDWIDSRSVGTVTRRLS